MSKQITLNVFNQSSIAAAAEEIRAYAEWVGRKAEALAKRLADYGLTQVAVGFNAVRYDGVKDVTVHLEKRSETSYAIVAEGATVLILEFGAGIRYGDGHPLAGALGYGPGTYPNQRRAIDPGYWYYTGSDGRGGHYSAGNAPGMVMYLTGMDLRNEVERIAQEVFNS